MYTQEDLKKIRQYDAKMGNCPNCGGRPGNVDCSMCRGTGKFGDQEELVEENHAPPFNPRDEMESFEQFRDLPEVKASQAAYDQWATDNN